MCCRSEHLTWGNKLRIKKRDVGRGNGIMDDRFKEGT